MAHRALQLLANEPAQRLNRGAGSGVAAEDRARTERPPRSRDSGEK